MRVAVIGSCVTRDAFELPRRPGIELDAYFARSSLASACSDAVMADVDTATISSPFQRRMVSHDLEKRFLRYVESGQFDLLVHDPIDERFDLVRRGDAIATRSNEFLRARSTGSSLSRITSGSDEFYALWEQGWTRLIMALDARGLRDRLRVNAVFWAQAAAGGADLRTVTSYEQTLEANRFLERLYVRMHRDLGASQFYTYAPHVLIAAAEHKWGLSPFHFTLEFYEQFVSMLESECV